MSRTFNRVAILGLGLLGGSVALAARRAGVARCLVGSGRRQAPLERAVANGVVDEIAGISEAVAGADLVVLATPVGAMEAILAQAVPALAPDARITDVGSVKGSLADRLPGLLPEGVHYVGAHPMAGSHERGVEFAVDNLFEDSCCVISPLRSTPVEARDDVADFWRALGARVVVRDPGAHDEEVAWVSHAPHVLAFAFARALEEAPEAAGELAGSGFRDFTRIARSDPGMWAEILNSNRKALASPLRAFGDSLAELTRVIEAGDIDSQEAFLAQAQAALDGVTRRASSPTSPRGCGDVRSGDENPEIQADQKSADPRRSKNNS
ncbi:MAG TPA: prephenate dehydrogenase/arogenate dehydrogenase family protein [Myxococcales bacterium]|nr:prephenate dehydrogenase/arogenate dehydrogenase family protein [Myxococcales bacterium]HIL02584.1 prephenate dehydrogenase/arogenate dehydrogenase family protein [Myxococcales bacterium]